MLTNSNVNLSGTITEQSIQKKADIPLPGSYKTDQLVYNYPMGSFNILHTPKVVCRRGADKDCYSFLGNINDDPSVAFRDYFITLDPIQIAVNKWVGYDLNKSKISVSIEVEHSGLNSEDIKGSGWTTCWDHDLFHKWEVEYPNKEFGSFEYVASKAQVADYHESHCEGDVGPKAWPFQGKVKIATYPLDVNCFTQQNTFRIKWAQDKITTSPDYFFDWARLAEDYSIDLHNEFSDGYHQQPPIEVYVKFLVNLVSTDGKVHQLINRYKANIEYEGPFDRCPDGNDTPYMVAHVKTYYDEVNQDKASTSPNDQFRHPNELPVDLNINLNYFLPFIQVLPIYRALNSINISGTSPVSLGSVYFQASNINVDPGASGTVVLPPGVIIQPRDFANFSGVSGLNPVDKATVQNFCTGLNNVYQVTGRHADHPFRTDLGPEFSSNTSLDKQNAKNFSISPNPSHIGDPLYLGTSEEGISKGTDHLLAQNQVFKSN